MAFVIKARGKAIEITGEISIENDMILRELFQTLKGNDEVLYKIVIGDNFTGVAQYSLDTIISSNVKEVAFLTEKECNNGKVFNCIRCGQCLRACKEGLNPIKLKELWDVKEENEFVKFGGKHCTSCGRCSHVCPSKIELSHIITTGKNYLNKR